MSAKSTAKGVLRSAKNLAKGYSDIEVKVREATSNDSLAPSSTLLSEISNATNNQYQFMEIMRMVDKRLNDKGKNWRHAYKALILLDYVIHSGNPLVINYAKENIFTFRTLLLFQYVDENSRDWGSSVRTKARDIISLIEDPDRLQEERTNIALLHQRLSSEYNSAIGSSDYPTSPPVSSGGYLDTTRSFPGSFEPASNQRSSSGGGGQHDILPKYDTSHRHSADEGFDTSELHAAIEESKKLAESHTHRLKKSEEELRLALELSRKEANQAETKKSARDLIELFEGPPSIDEEASQEQSNSAPDLSSNLLNISQHPSMGFQQQSNGSYAMYGSSQGVEAQLQGFPYSQSVAMMDPNRAVGSGNIVFMPVTNPGSSLYPSQTPQMQPSFSMMPQSFPFLGNSRSSYSVPPVLPSAQPAPLTTSKPDPFADLANEASLSLKKSSSIHQTGLQDEKSYGSNKYGSYTTTTNADKFRTKFPPVSSLYHAEPSTLDSHLTKTTIPPNSVPTALIYASKDESLEPFQRPAHSSSTAHPSELDDLLL